MSFSPHEIKWTPEEIARIWEYYSTSPAYRGQYFGAQSGRYVAEMIDRRLGFRGFRRILDFGCGTGDIIAACLPYLKSPQSMFGVDPSPSSVEQVSKRFGGTVEFGGASAMAGPLTAHPDASFDLVIATEVVEHLSDVDLEVTINELRRLVSPGGYCFLTTPNNEDRDANKVLCPECGAIFHRWQHLRSWTAESIQARMESHGFSTRLVTPVVWASRFRRLLTVIKPLPKSGLVYIGGR